MSAESVRANQVLPERRLPIPLICNSPPLIRHTVFRHQKICLGIPATIRSDATMQNVPGQQHATFTSTSGRGNARCRKNTARAIVKCGNRCKRLPENHADCATATAPVSVSA